MRSASTALTYIWLAAAGFIVGCEPEKIDAYRNPLDVMEKKLPASAGKSDYILARMEYGQSAMDLGCYLRAEPALEEARQQFSADKSNIAATVSSEKHKFYKGETYERACLCNYLGYIKYLNGDFNNARIYFSNAVNEDRKAVGENGNPLYGDDFSLSYYWLGRAYMKLGDGDNAAIAMKKAARESVREQADLDNEKKDDQNFFEKKYKKMLDGEEWCWKTFNNPEKPELVVKDMINLTKVSQNISQADVVQKNAAAKSPLRTAAKTRDEFFTTDFQNKANLIMTIEVGNPPYKTLAGAKNELTQINKLHIQPFYAYVYVDGHPLGKAFRVLELWDQATTQSRVGAKDAAQVTKAVLMTVAEQLIGTSWDVSGDVRYWHSLPGRVFISAVDAEPGIHTVQIDFYDINGKFLPRWTNVYPGVKVTDKKETLMLLRPTFDGNNSITPIEYANARKAGANPYGWKYPDKPE
ncbi:MAG TPA: hypothetical protein PKK48_05950 [Phycisphaerae bacterium]|nr:hypothetical protein [Phycisphaerae bacterium]HPS53596.1 hypothetical protein [Phycisphaerae bacterium]